MSVQRAQHGPKLPAQRGTPLFAVAGALLVTLLLCLALAESGTAHRARAVQEASVFTTAEELIAQGRDVPGVHPTLPICPPLAPDPGFASRAAVHRAAAVVDLSTPAACQVDKSRGVIEIKSGSATEARTLVAQRGQRTLHHTGSPARHWAGPGSVNYNKHGVASVIQAVNPNVDHGGAEEFVNGRTLALSSNTYWAEAGWTERSYFPDAPYAFGCGKFNCFYDTPQFFPLSTNGWYWFRAYHCAPPGGFYVCADMLYANTWVNLWTTDGARCTHSNGTGDCHVENQAEAHSYDSTPHPAFGGGGMNFAVGELQIDNGFWVQWTTAYGTNATPTSPYVIHWYTHYSDFVACQGSCG